MKFKILSLNDIEDLNCLAEDVLHELRFYPYMYSDSGEYNAHYDAKEREKQISFDEVVRMSHKKIIDTYLKDYLSKFRGIMRKGSFPLTPFIVSDEITDEHLDNLFALRYKENLKLWTIQYECGRI